MKTRGREYTRGLTAAVLLGSQRSEQDQEKAFKSVHKWVSDVDIFSAKLGCRVFDSMQFDKFDSRAALIER